MTEMDTVLAIGQANYREIVFNRWVILGVGLVALAEFAVTMLVMSRTWVTLRRNDVLLTLMEKNAALTEAQRNQTRTALKDVTEQATLMTNIVADAKKETGSGLNPRPPQSGTDSGPGDRR